MFVRATKLLNQGQVRRRGYAITKYGDMGVRRARLQGKNSEGQIGLSQSPIWDEDPKGYRITQEGAGIPIQRAEHRPGCLVALP